MWTLKTQGLRQAISGAVLIGTALALNACNPLNGEGIRIYDSREDAKPPQTSAASAAAKNGKGTTSSNAAKPGTSTSACTTQELIGDASELDELKSLNDEVKDLETKYPKRHDLSNAVIAYAKGPLGLTGAELKSLVTGIMRLSRKQAQQPAPASPAPGSEPSASNRSMARASALAATPTSAAAAPAETPQPPAIVHPSAVAFAIYKGAIEFASQQNLDPKDINPKAFAAALGNDAQGLERLAAYQHAFTFAKAQKDVLKLSSVKDFHLFAVRFVSSLTPAQLILTYIEVYTVEIAANSPTTDAQTAAEKATCLSPVSSK
jgi:hypothetical protein